MSRAASTTVAASTSSSSTKGKPSSSSSSAKAKTRSPASGLSSLPLSDPKRWKVVYPAYLNSKRTVADGRRVPQRLAVERPSVLDIAEACQLLSLPCLIEDKSYCRDAFTSRGRVRVQLYRDDRSPLRPDAINRQRLLLLIAAQMPNLKNRPARLEQEKKREEKELKEMQQFLGTGGPGANAAGEAGEGGKKKKKK